MALALLISRANNDWQFYDENNPIWEKWTNRNNSYFAGKSANQTPFLKLRLWTKLSANSGFYSVKCLSSMHNLDDISFKIQLNFYIDREQMIRATPSMKVSIFGFNGSPVFLIWAKFDIVVKTFLNMRSKKFVHVTWNILRTKMKTISVKSLIQTFVTYSHEVKNFVFLICTRSEEQMRKTGIFTPVLHW